MSRRGWLILGVLAIGTATLILVPTHTVQRSGPVDTEESHALTTLGCAWELVRGYAQAVHSGVITAEDKAALLNSGWQAKLLEANYLSANIRYLKQSRYTWHISPAVVGKKLTELSGGEVLVFLDKPSSSDELRGYRRFAAMQASGATLDAASLEQQIKISR